MATTPAPDSIPYPDPSDVPDVPYWMKAQADRVAVLVAAAADAARAAADVAAAARATVTQTVDLALAPVDAQVDAGIDRAETAGRLLTAQVATDTYAPLTAIEGMELVAWDDFGRTDANLGAAPWGYTYKQTVSLTGMDGQIVTHPTLGRPVFRSVDVTPGTSGSAYLGWYMPNGERFDKMVVQFGIDHGGDGTGANSSVAIGVCGDPDASGVAANNIQAIIDESVHTIVTRTNMAVQARNFASTPTRLVLPANLARDTTEVYEASIEFTADDTIKITAPNGTTATYTNAEVAALSGPGTYIQAVHQAATNGDSTFIVGYQCYQRVGAKPVPNAKIAKVYPLDPFEQVRRSAAITTRPRKMIHAYDTLLPRVRQQLTSGRLELTKLPRQAGDELVDRITVLGSDVAMAGATLVEYSLFEQDFDTLTLRAVTSSSPGTQLQVNFDTAGAVYTRAFAATVRDTITFPLTFTLQHDRDYWIGVLVVGGSNAGSVQGITRTAGEFGTVLGERRAGSKTGLTETPTSIVTSTLTTPAYRIWAAVGRL